MGLRLRDRRAGQPAMETEDAFGRGLDRVYLQHGFNVRDLLSHALCSQRLPWRALEKRRGSQSTSGYGPPISDPSEGLDSSLKRVTFQVQSGSRDGIIENRYGLRAACLDDAGPC